MRKCPALPDFSYLQFKFHIDRRMVRRISKRGVELPGFGWSRPTIGQHSRVGYAVEQLGRSIEEVDTTTQDCIILLAIAVTMTDDILQIGLLEQHVVRDELCRIGGAVVVVPIVKARVRVRIASQKSNTPQPSLPPD